MSAEANKERKLRARSDQVKLKNNSYEAIKCFVSQTNFDVPDLGYPDFLIIWTFLCVPKLFMMNFTLPILYLLTGTAVEQSVKVGRDSFIPSSS